MKFIANIIAGIKRAKRISEIAHAVTDILKMAAERLEQVNISLLNKSEDKPETE